MNVSVVKYGMFAHPYHIMNVYLPLNMKRVVNCTFPCHWGKKRTPFVLVVFIVCMER